MFNTFDIRQPIQFEDRNQAASEAKRHLSNPRVPLGSHLRIWFHVMKNSGCSPLLPSDRSPLKPPLSAWQNWCCILLLPQPVQISMHTSFLLLHN